MVIGRGGGPRQGAEPGSPAVVGACSSRPSPAGRHGWKLLNQRLTRKRGRSRRRHPSTETPSLDRDTKEHRKLTRCRDRRPSRQRKQTWSRGLSKEESHDGHLKFKSPIRHPSNCFRARKGAARSRAPMDHGSCISKWCSRTTTLLSPPPAAQIMHPTRAKAYQRTSLTHAHGRVWLWRSCLQSQLSIDRPAARLCGQEQASGMQ